MNSLLIFTILILCILLLALSYVKDKKTDFTGFRIYKKNGESPLVETSDKITATATEREFLLYEILLYHVELKDDDGKVLKDVKMNSNLAIILALLKPCTLNWVATVVKK